MTNDRNHQPNKQGALTSLKGYFFVVSIWGSCLKLLWVGNTCLLFPSLPVLVRLLPQVTLVFIFISTSSIVPAYSIPLGYVYKFQLAQGLCLPIQFSEDMCTNFVFLSSDQYGICAYIFNSRRICAQVLCCSNLNGICACIFNSWRTCAHIPFFRKNEIIDYFYETS